jgi:hypothetical protein
MPGSGVIAVERSQLVTQDVDVLAGPGRVAPADVRASSQLRFGVPPSRTLRD